MMLVFMVMLIDWCSIRLMRTNSRSSSVGHFLFGSVQGFSTFTYTLVAITMNNNSTLYSMHIYVYRGIHLSKRYTCINNIYIYILYTWVVVVVVVVEVRWLVIPFQYVANAVEARHVTPRAIASACMHTKAGGLFWWVHDMHILASLLATGTVYTSYYACPMQ